MTRIEISALQDNPEEAAKKVIAALHEGNEVIIKHLPDEDRSREYELAVYVAEADGVDTVGIVTCGVHDSYLLFSLA